MKPFLSTRFKNLLSGIGSCLLFFIFFASSNATPNRILLDDYSKGLNDKWKTKSFSGYTQYTVAKESDGYVIHAQSRNAASGLFYKIDYDTKKLPILSWQWKITGTIAGGNGYTKEGDDYAARIYVVFPSLFFWNTKAINYIWANTIPKGEAVPNAFTANARMVAVESGNENAGKWLVETRNIFDDFINLFGTAPPHAGAVAIMTDTDNTGKTAEAWYGLIYLEALNPEVRPAKEKN